MSVGLRAEGVSKTFHKNVALHNIHLSVDKGEFVCLLGPSGCGKSTLLRIMAGLEAPSDGKIYINDRDVTHLPPSKRNFGIMFQSYALFPNLTAFENVAYGLRNQKIRERDITKRVDRLFDIIHLSDAKGRVPAQLSGGEQQRVALARALALEPDFLLLDEPLSALDAKVRQELRRQICSIQKQMKLTTIMVTHDQDEALTMADRIVVMNKANIMQEGTPEEIYETPVNPFVADFIGTINFIDKERGELYQWGHSPLTAVRPEKIKLSKKAMPQGVSSDILDIEFRGSFYRILIRTRHVNDDLTLHVDVPFTTFKEMELRRGQQIYFSIPREGMLHFEKA
ncbi:ABC transporter ATP-binding protein [Diplocloster agilis]|uniref:ABC-type quaternary amine transporter n=1 Tax=Diplocloster agilis TaxID=2850323 RepID=A0A949K3U4_9FIRM|nr:ATP-binding cassette domain-containing protein [Diplocloster agilis]MBU9736176.1 ATP-binding cassette domain-containing protein [Diplocloster agilis]MBU9744528.1 ATP-binding cassette domain-containing protein [Diplocloster agilis]